MNKSHRINDEPTPSLCRVPWSVATACVVTASIYLLFTNLDHSHIWEDEGATAVVAKTLLDTGDISGWDGRNLVGCPEALCLNSEGRIVLPPMMFLLTAAGIAVAGENEVGFRIAHAFCGLLALGLLWALCRRVMPNAPRLHFLIVTFAALSPQLLMYFRASRYYAFSVLAMLLSIYAYERWRERKNDWWLLALALVTVLAFLNHYAIGSVGALSIAITHLIFRGNEVSRADAVKGAMFAIPVLVACVAYLWWIGVIGQDRWGISHYSVHPPYQGADLLLRMGTLLSGITRADWISWWIAPWFVACCVRLFSSKRSPDIAHHSATILVLLGLTGIVFSGMVEEYVVQHSVHWDGGTLRYSAFALPLVLVMKALFVDRLWSENKIFGAVSLVALIMTSVGSFPLTMGTQIGFRYDLTSYISEIHYSYVDGLQRVRAYLGTHAQSDDLVEVRHAPMLNEPLTASMGNDLLFCCVVPRDGAKQVHESVKQKWANHVWQDAHPDWIISAKPGVRDAELDEHYILATYIHGNIGFPNPQRPEVNWHRWAPPYIENATAVYKRKSPGENN